MNDKIRLKNLSYQKIEIKLACQFRVGEYKGTKKPAAK